VAIDGDQRTLLAGRELLQRDKLSFEEGFEICTVKVDLFGRVLE
jgi:hypothetical protein